MHRIIPQRAILRQPDRHAKNICIIAEDKRSSLERTFLACAGTGHMAWGTRIHQGRVVATATMEDYSCKDCKTNYISKHSHLHFRLNLICSVMVIRTRFLRNQV